MSHLQRVRYCSQLGLLAMLLLLFGPLVGQWVNWETSESNWHSEQANNHEHHALLNINQAHDEAATNNHEHHKSSSINHELDWVNCGYCDLLLSSPAIPNYTLQTQPYLESFTLSVLPVLLIVKYDTVFIGALTRAPPIS